MNLRQVVKMAVAVGMVFVWGLLVGFGNYSWAGEKGLVGYWKFDEGKENIAKDSSGNNNHGKIYDAVYVKGKKGFALQFALHFDHGRYDYVDCGNDASLNITDGITIEAWVKTSGSTNQCISESRDISSPYNGWSFSIGANGKVYLQIDSSAGTKAAVAVASISTGGWHHVAGTWDGSTINIFVDGVNKNSNSHGGTISKNVATRIGKPTQGGQYYFNGLIDEVCIFNRALTAQEIKKNYEENEVQVGKNEKDNKIQEKRSKEMKSAIKKRKDNKVVNSNRRGGYFEYLHAVIKKAPLRSHYNFCTKITDLPDGRLLMSWCGTVGAEMSPANKIWISFSSDEAITWSEPEILTDSSRGLVSNDCCYTHSDGTAFVFYDWRQGLDFGGWSSSEAKIGYKTSCDSGRTWSEQQAIDPSVKRQTPYACPIRLQNGTVLLPFTYSCSGPSSYCNSFLLSADGCKTWKRGGDITHPKFWLAEPTVVELSNGDIYCLLRPAYKHAGCQWQAWSKDGGMTWTNPSPSRFASPSSCAALLRLKSGNIVLVWNNRKSKSGHPRSPLSVAMSEDDAETWPYQKMIVRADPYRSPGFSNHGVFQTKSGIIVVAIPWNGEIDIARFDETWIRSTIDSGK